MKYICLIKYLREKDEIRPDLSLIVWQNEAKFSLSDPLVCLFDPLIKTS